MPSSRLPLAPPGAARFVTGRVILACGASFALRAASGPVQSFRLAPGSPLLPEDLVALALSAASLTVEFRPAAKPGVPMAQRIFFGGR